MSCIAMRSVYYAVKGKKIRGRAAERNQQPTDTL